MIYIETGSTDVYYNFGLENYFATEKRLPDTVFLFWRTTPTLMVGKYQNILEEINKPYADAHGIHLVRRMSGGGTIYTDLGGWQFTFIEHSPEQQIEFAQYIGPVVDAVRECQLQWPQRSADRRQEIFRQRAVPSGRLYCAPWLFAL